MEITYLDIRSYYNLRHVTPLAITGRSMPHSCTTMWWTPIPISARANRRERRGIIGTTKRAKWRITRRMTTTHRHDHAGGRSRSHDDHPRCHCGLLGVELPLEAALACVILCQLLQSMRYHHHWPSGRGQHLPADPSTTCNAKLVDLTMPRLVNLVTGVPLPVVGARQVD